LKRASAFSSSTGPEAPQEHQHRVLAHPEHSVLPKGDAERLDRAQAPPHHQKAVFVGPSPGGIVGDGRQAGLGQQEAQQSPLEPMAR
jgi:hypothetical protein